MTVVAVYLIGCSGPEATGEGRSSEPGGQGCDVGQREKRVDGTNDLILLSFQTADLHVCVPPAYSTIFPPLIFPYIM